MPPTRSSRSTSAALLIQSIVRQSATLLTQLANTGGRRAPLAQATSQVFLDLAQELERLGVSRKVSADMFGLGLRTYQRKLQRATVTSGSTHGRSLNEEVLEYVRSAQIVARSDVFARFSDADDAQLRASLRELREGGLLFTLGKGSGTAYRATTPAEVAALSTRYDRQDAAVDDRLPASDIQPPILVNVAGEGTYAVAVWEGHPLEQEALDILRQLRHLLAELRARVAEADGQQTQLAPAASAVLCLEPFGAKSV